MAKKNGKQKEKILVGEGDEALTRIATQKALEKAGLLDVIDVKKQEVDVKEGVYHFHRKVSFTMRGSLVREADTDSAATCQIPLYATLAVALHKAGVQGDNIRKTILQAVQEVVKQDEQSLESKLAELCPDIDAQIRKIKEGVVKKLPRIPKKGSLKAQAFTVENFSAEPIGTVDTD